MSHSYWSRCREKAQLESLNRQLILDCMAMSRFLVADSPTLEMRAYALATAEKHQGPKMARAKAA